MAKAGHMAVSNQYDVSYAFFSEYVNSVTQNLPWGLTCQNPDGCSISQIRCDAMNDCWGSLGTCLLNGQCKCRSNEWKGGDCSLQSTKLGGGMVVYKKSYGPKYHAFHYEGSSKTSYMTVSTTVPMDIYISIDAS